MAASQIFEKKGLAGSFLVPFGRPWANEVRPGRLPTHRFGVANVAGDPVGVLGLPFGAGDSYFGLLWNAFWFFLVPLGCTTSGTQSFLHWVPNVNWTMAQCTLDHGFPMFFCIYGGFYIGGPM